MMIRRLSSAHFAVLGLVLFGLQGAPWTDAQESEPPVATVVAARGGVQAIAGDGATRQLQIKSPIHQGDTLKTGKRGRVQILFTDGTTISLGRNTVLEVSLYEYKPEQSEGALVTHVDEGVFRVLGGAITKFAPENFKVKTPTVTIGVRGSSFMGSLSGTELTIVFLGGIGIVLDNQAGTFEIRRPNFGTVVRTSFSRPEALRRFTTAEIRGLLDHLMGVGQAPDGEGRGGAEDRQPKGGEPQGSLDQEGPPGGRGLEEPASPGPEGDSNEYEVIATLITWLEGASTLANQNTAVPAGEEGGTEEPPSEPGQSVPNQLHNGHAVGIADVSPLLARSRASDSQAIIHNNDDPNDATDNASDYFQFTTQEGAPGRLEGSGSLELSDRADRSTGPMAFSESNASRGVSDYAFAAQFNDGPGDLVNNLSGSIKTADEALGNTAQSTTQPESWWNWGVWNVDFDNGTDRYTTSELPTGAPAGYWIAGVRTARDYIRGLINNDATGVYNGGARCIEQPAEGAMAEYSGGSRFLVDFGGRAITGELNFSAAGGPSMGVSAQIGQGNRDFLGTILDVTPPGGDRAEPVNSRVGGSFFGPTANSIGGTFNAETTNTKYIGVFGADAD